MALIICPATPEAVLLLIEERRKRSFFYAFGPLPIVRQMLGLAVLSLLAVMAISLSSDINTENMGKTLLEMEGWPLLKVEIFLLSAASLGCCFQNLQQINAEISSGAYDPKLQSAYWTRWVMGLISGVILSHIVYQIFDSLSHNAQSSSVPAILGQPVLALLGGYSVDVVVGILSQIIDAIGSVFRARTGAPGDASKADTPEAAAARERLKIASEVSELRGNLSKDSSSEEILSRFDDMIKRNIAP